MNLDTARESIIAHPWRSIATAFFAGMCLAYGDGRQGRARTSLAISLGLGLLEELARPRAKSWIDAREIPFTAH